MGEAWGAIAVAVLSKKITVLCFSSCLGRWQRGAGDDREGGGTAVSIGGMVER